MTENMASIAGVSVDKNNTNFLLYNRVQNSVEKDICVKGRWLYCKKCKRESELDGVAIPDKSQSDTQIVLVLAIGEGCGKHYKLSKTDKRKLDMLPGVSIGVKVYDRIVCPEDHLWGIMRSPYAEDEYFIHECVAIAVLGE